jgi:hypothetical protein
MKSLTFQEKEEWQNAQFRIFLKYKITRGKGKEIRLRTLS